MHNRDFYFDAKSYHEIVWPDVPFERDDQVLYVVRRGSESHNTYIAPTDPNSVDDRDIYAVLAPPKNYYLGLQRWEHAEAIKTGPDGTIWDVCMDELLKFVGMLTKCNPNVACSVWARPEDQIYVHPAFNKLLEKRELFLTRGYGFMAFGGYARAQAKKMKLNAYNGIMGAKRKALVDKFGYDCKNAAHCIRLMHMGIELMRDGKIIPWRTWDRDMILQIKTGGWTFERVSEYFVQLENDLVAAHAVSALPDMPDTEAIDKLVTDMLWSLLGGDK